MFLTYKVAYHKEYLTSGQEEYKLRMELADIIMCVASSVTIYALVAGKIVLPLIK